MSKLVTARANNTWYSAEEWARAYQRAAAILGLPPRGKRGSAQNRERARKGVQVAHAARRLLWLERAERRHNGKT